MDSSSPTDFADTINEILAILAQVAPSPRPFFMIGDEEEEEEEELKADEEEEEDIMMMEEEDDCHVFFY
uniref:Uncharacterized protein n=1 Tax=Caenorhabditis tropicalis TaxID=1561998 RepID=A0A1I7UZE9_9PELO